MFSVGTFHFLKLGCCEFLCHLFTVNVWVALDNIHEDFVVFSRRENSRSYSVGSSQWIKFVKRQLQLGFGPFSFYLKT
jgi:hypothetical protein